MDTRIVQLTDLHLHRDPAARLAGVDTWRTFRAVLDCVRRDHGNFDHLVLTGDFAQDESLETYLMLREALGEWTGRCRLVPGNHDDPAKLRQAFPECVENAHGPLTFDLAGNAWHVIGLDSHLPGEVKGRVDGEQLAWLASRLAERRDTPTLLFMHHPPLPIRVEWLDEIGMDTPAGLVDLIEISPQVKIVCAGHVHQAFSGRIGTAAMFTTPSTCVQFAARADKTFDTRAAGYRTFTLHDDGHFDTGVHRIS